ncbi:hypothetical protein, partial [Burkholderia glumae]|uniref:hypothetical protein n=1 Tax=Burkholderia glumae TaxID=337 RepID=UPI0019D6B887
MRIRIGRFASTAARTKRGVRIGARVGIGIRSRAGIPPGASPAMSAPPRRRALIAAGLGAA